MISLAPIDEGKDLITKEWLEQNITRTAVISQTYTGVYNDNTSYPYWMFIRMIPNDNVGMWHVFYRMRVYTSNANASYRGEYYCEFWGYNRTCTGYKIWNSRRDYPFHYHSAFWSSSDANALKYGHFLGIYFNNANNDTNVNYKRTLEVEIIAYDGCSVELLPNAVRYNTATTMKVNGVDTSVTISSYGNATNYNATSNGLQETSDSDSYYLGYMNGGRPFIGLDRISRYSIVGMSAEGKLQQFSFYQSGTTMYSTSMAKKSSGIRTYSTRGFDYTRGLFYNGGTEFGAGAVFTSALYYYHSAPDFRYTDNCVASSTANNLGLVNGKPIYIRGKILKDGLFYVKPFQTVTYGSDGDNVYQKCWTQDIPTKPDGYVYWYVGYPYYNSSYPNSLYQIALAPDNKLYKTYKDGFREYVPKASTAYEDNLKKPVVVKRAVPICTIHPGIKYCGVRMCFKFACRITNRNTKECRLRHRIKLSWWDKLQYELGIQSKGWIGTTNNVTYITNPITETMDGVEYLTGFFLSTLGTETRDNSMLFFYMSEEQTAKCVWTDGEELFIGNMPNADVTSTPYLHLSNSVVYCDKPISAFGKNEIGTINRHYNCYRFSFYRRFVRRPRKEGKIRIAYKWTNPRPRRWNIDVSLPHAGKMRVYPMVKGKVSCHYAEIKIRRR